MAPQFDLSCKNTKPTLTTTKTAGEPWHSMKICAFFEKTHGGLVK